jgi:hypothetical protein
MFSAALGIIGGIGSIIQGGYQYDMGLKELALKKKAMAQERDFGMLNYGLALDQIRKEDEQTDYIKKQNERNQLAQSMERAKIEEQRQQRLAAYQDERDYVLNRQIEIDRAQAAQYALELESYLSNKGLAKEERELALSYLEQSKAVARGERDDDLRQRRLERLTAQQERDFAISEMRNSQSVAQRERADDMAYRDSINQKLNKMGDELQIAYASMGQLNAPRGMSEADIMSTLDRFDNNAMANVDRAANRVASQAEASLIDSGMSRSTAGEQRRAEVTRKLALDYDNARLAARNQAMEYIKGRDDLTNSDFQRQLASRGRTFEEISSLYNPIISGLMQNRQTLSANSYQTPVQIGSGNVIRDVASANQYAAPLSIGSAIFSPSGMTSSMGQTLNTPSSADAYVTTGDYNQFQPQMWNLTSPSGYMSNATSIFQNLPNQYDPNTFLNMGMETMSSGFSALGGGLNDLSKSWGGRTTPAAASARGNPDPWAGMRSTQTKSYNPTGWSLSGSRFQ